MMLKRAGLLATALTALTMTTSAFAGTLVVNAFASDPAPKAALQGLIDGFKQKHPAVDVKWNNFDSEGYKTAIRNFLTAEPPDVVAWYAGNRMAPFVQAGLLDDVTDVWVKNGLDESLRSAAELVTIGGKKWGVPYSYYQWGIYYRQDIFDKHGIAVPKTWDELLAACAKLKRNGVTPIAIGSKALWPTAGWFDYINFRLNGYEFHRDLTNGKIPYTDPKVKEVFKKWAELVEPGYFTANHASYDWQEAAPFFVNGQAAMYLMGNSAIEVFKSAGITGDQLGFFQFPTITPGVPRVEDAPTDTMHIPAKAKNKEDARKFLAYLASAEAQTAMNKTLGQLPVNRDAERPKDKYLATGFEMLSNASALAQFYDRDAPPEMAKAGMEGFQQFMMKPENVDKILDRLEKVRARVYK
jgi:multiple sugar transport system substrate-binding protein